MEKQPETTMNRSNGTALVIGMHGGFGGSVARALVKRGFGIHALTRREAPAAEHGVRWMRGDALNAAEVLAAARDTNLIVHAAHPPGYRNWRSHGLPMLENSIAAARQCGATLLFPGNIYNFGPDAGQRLSEDSPQRPLTRKGRIRVQMEQMLSDASREGVRSIVIRCGDFFGPEGHSSWFSHALVKPGRPVTRISYPGPQAAGHSWAYLPDVGEAAAELALRRAGFAPFETFHFAGHWLPRGVQMAETICDIAGIPRARIGGFPWWGIRALSPFVKTLREMLEMRYIWEQSLALDNRKLVATLGSEPRTELRAAVHDTLAALGCLDATAEPRAVTG
jgi:nucleoside-diphosphate-sugar epimerase